VPAQATTPLTLAHTASASEVAPRSSSSASAPTSAGRWISDAYKFDTSLASNISKAMASAAAEDRLAPVFGGMSLKEASMVNATNFTRKVKTTCQEE
jgi:hypothetical protein